MLVRYAETVASEYVKLRCHLNASGLVLPKKINVCMPRSIMAVLMVRQDLRWAIVGWARMIFNGRFPCFTHRRVIQRVCKTYTHSSMFKEGRIMPRLCRIVTIHTNAEWPARLSHLCYLAAPRTQTYSYKYANERHTSILIGGGNTHSR